MGYFNVLKGAYPSLQQIDTVLDVGSDETGLVRGSLMYVDASGTKPVFRVAGVTQATVPAAYLYFSLIPQDDFVAGMAGTIGQGLTGGVARVNGLAVGMPMEFETDQYTGEFEVGDLLTVGADGKLVAHDSGDNCVAQVTRSVNNKWVNSAVAVTGRKTGAHLPVLAGRTLWIPKLVTA
jgi:hypothetical protein